MARPAATIRVPDAHDPVILAVVIEPHDRMTIIGDAEVIRSLHDRYDPERGPAPSDDNSNATG